ncbi:MAG: glycosyltransferase family 2 protein [Candidatus Magasanikbacteria bacterium]|jgi:glycosyltransferase involved in cell wall biosynthesis|nr:glycosyltransferase family 2 protein [Candidatus Magasanikbacteria bacterium]MBT4071549.1 glycosyltransferase family 2 protein [Candidatus Magasanikbacteria bacterium]
MKYKHINVCLCAYNAEAFIEKTINSILSQTYTHFTLFIVNDASTDGTKSIIEQFVKKDNRVVFIDLKKNIGTYAAKNLVLKEFAIGDFWAHHDADDYSDSKRFEKQIEYLEKFNLDGCGTAINEFYTDGISPRIPSNFPLVLNNTDGFYYRANYYPEKISTETVLDNIDDLAKLKIAMNGSLMFRLDLVQQLGGFDGHTRFGADSDFLWRFITFYNFGNIQEVLYNRRFHGSSLTQSKKTGWNSDIRKKYANEIKEKHIKRLKFLHENEKKLAWKHSVYDMFYPEVSYNIYKK